MITKFVLVMAIKIHMTTAPTFAVISTEKTMDECMAEMIRVSYVWPEEKRKSLACWAITEEITNQ